MSPCSTEEQLCPLTSGQGGGLRGPLESCVPHVYGCRAGGCHRCPRKPDEKGPSHQPGLRGGVGRRGQAWRCRRGRSEDVRGCSATKQSHRGSGAGPSRTGLCGVGGEQPTTGPGRPVELGGQGRRRETVPKQEKKLPRGPRRRPAGRTLSECRRAPAATAPSRSDCPRLTFSRSFPQPWRSEKDSRRGPEEAGVDERGKKPPRPACCPAPSRASASSAQVGRRQVRLWVEFRAVVITLD